MIWFARKSPAALGLPFLTSNLFKAWFRDNVPLFEAVDYTVFTSVLALVGAAGSVFRRPLFSVSIPWIYWSVFAGLTLSMFSATPIEYGWALREFLQFAGFGAVAVVAPIFLFRFERDLNVFWKALLFTTVLVALTTLLSAPHPSTNRSVFIGGPDSITHARLFAMGILVIAYGWPQVPWGTTPANRVLSLLLVALFLVGILYSGSRGPFLHLVLCFGVFVFVRESPTRWKLATLVSGLFLFTVVWTMLPESPVLERISKLPDVTYTGGDASIGYRLHAWNYVLETWNESFYFGHGLGVIERRHGIQPHSIMLDILYSGGFVSIMLFFALVVACLVSWWTRPHVPHGRSTFQHYYPAFGLMIFGLITSTTGYESTGTRYVLFLFSVLISASSIWRRQAIDAGLAAVHSTSVAGRETGTNQAKKIW